MRSPLISFVIWALILLAAVGVYAALKIAVNDKSLAVANLSRQIEAKNVESARLSAVREQLSALANDEAAVEAYFVPESSVVALIDELQGRGRALGASVEIASVAATPGASGARPTIAIALSATGPFDAVMRTIGSIEYAPYDLHATGVTLSEGLDGKTWSANLNLSVGSSVTGVVAAPPGPATPAVMATTSTAH